MPTLVPYSKKYRLGRGTVHFNPLVAGVYEGFFRLGNCPDYSLTLKGKQLVHESSEKGLSETDLDKLISIERSAKITCDNLSDRILQTYLAGTSVTLSQAGATVTAEAMGVVHAGRMYKLGVTTNVPDGVNRISAVALTISAANFVVSTAYTAGQVLLNPTPDAFAYLVTVGGTSAVSLPAFPSAGATVTSGGVTIKNIGSSAFTNLTAFTFDAELGYVNVLETGNIATLAAAAEALGGAISLLAGYTKAASTVVQIKTGAAAGLNGQLLFLVEDPLDDGVITQWLFPSVSLTPDGDLSLITGDKLQEAKFSVGISLLDSNTPAIKRNGAPALA